MNTSANSSNNKKKSGRINESHLSPDTRSLIKGLIKQSRLNETQRRIMDQLIKGGTSLPANPTSNSAPIKALEAAYQSKARQRIPVKTRPRIRMLDSMIRSGAYDIEPYRPLATKDLSLEKEKLQNLMSGEQEDSLQSVELSEDDEIEELDERKMLIQDIKERRAWLDDMTKLNRGDKFRSQIESEIAVVCTLCNILEIKSNQPMLLSDTLFAKKGALAKIWLASHFERKLSKAQLIQTNIHSSVDAIMDQTSESPMALRLSGQLLLGVVRIFSKKTKYLLEDCNEAILRFKMSFKPGSVNLTADQAMSSVNAITVGENVNELEILLLEPVLDLKALIQKPVPSTPSQRERSRLHEITLSQEIPRMMDTTFPEIDIANDPLDMMNTGSMEIEVGRDAPLSDAIQPFQRDSFLENDDLNDQGPQFDFGDNLNFEPEAHLNFSPKLNNDQDTLKNDKRKSAAEYSDMNEINLGFDVDVTRIKKARTNKSAAAARQQNRKKRLIMDSTIELNMDAIMEGVRNTSSTIKTPSYLPCSRKMQKLQDFRELNLDQILVSSIPKSLRFMFDVNKLASADEFNEDIPLQESFDDPPPLDQAPPDLVDNDYNFDHLTDNGDYRENFSVDLPPLNDLDPSQTPQKNLSFVQDFSEGLGDVQFTPTPKKNVHASNIIFPSPIRQDHINGEQLSDFLENVDPLAMMNQTKLKDGSNNGMSTSTKIAISILKETLNNCKDSISFYEISSKMEKKDKIRMFFETLVLKTQDWIKVDQKDPYSTIEIKATQKLFL